MTVARRCVLLPYQFLVRACWILPGVSLRAVSGAALQAGAGAAVRLEAERRCGLEPARCCGPEPVRLRLLGPERRYVRAGSCRACRYML